MVAHRILCLAILSWCIMVVSAEAAAADKSGCKRECGSISVPYPFGLDSSECYKDSGFKLTCNESSTPPALLLLDEINVLSISVENATAIVEHSIAFDCYNESGSSTYMYPTMSLEGSPFMFSTHNIFFAIGCDTKAYFSDMNVTGVAKGCISWCTYGNDSTQDDPIDFAEELVSCSGTGCCQTTVPKHLQTLYYEITSYYNHTYQLETNPCSFGFLADPAWFNSSSHFTLKDTPEKHSNSQVLVDWDIGNLTCAQVRKSGADPICAMNAVCGNSSNGRGYLCSCKDGFQGNPYIDCQDIDECSPEYGNKYPCTGSCKNTIGSYVCDCSFGYGGDGKVGCSVKSVTKVVFAIGICVFAAIFVLPLLWVNKKRIQERNHRKNGGLLLKHLSVKVFQKAELEKATNNFDARKILGEGGNGWVYKGLANNTEIAVKKSKLIDQDQIEQFLNEVDIVSKINHKNVVKLLGICLETKVPMLVYEFVPNATLFHYIHGKDQSVLYSWPTCLRIATETAGALDYMHSLAHPPIIHRDIKSANILLDGKYTAKVADFGASKLIPLDQTIAPTRGQGTMGYLDPEYLQTGELTVKSDVYGFGIVLMELLCKSKPIYRGVSGEMISIVQVFTSALEDDRLNQVVKIEDVNECQAEQIEIVAKLAVKCVKMPSKDRPTMTEVADVLAQLNQEYKNVQVEGCGEDIVNLLDGDEISTSMTFELEYSGW